MSVSVFFYFSPFATHFKHTIIKKKKKKCPWTQETFSLSKGFCFGILPPWRDKLANPSLLSMGYCFPCAYIRVCVCERGETGKVCMCVCERDKILDSACVNLCMRKTVWRRGEVVLAEILLTAELLSKLPLLFTHTSSPKHLLGNFCCQE